MPSIASKLESLGIVLPEPFKPVGLYKPVSIVGRRLYVSGHGPWPNGEAIKAKVGSELTVREAADAARHVGLGILSTLEHQVGLDNVLRLYRTFGMVNSEPRFEKHPQVIDGFSALMVEVFGPDRGMGARSAVGVNSLPFGIAVEIEAEFILRRGWRSRLTGRAQATTRAQETSPSQTNVPGSVHAQAPGLAPSAQAMPVSARPPIPG